MQFERTDLPLISAECRDVRDVTTLTRQLLVDAMAAKSHRQQRLCDMRLRYLIAVASLYLQPDRPGATVILAP